MLIIFYPLEESCSALCAFGSVRAPMQEEQSFTYLFRASKQEEQSLFYIFPQGSQVGRKQPISHISSGLSSRKNNPYFTYFVKAPKQEEQSTYFFSAPKQEEQPIYFFRAPKQKEQHLFHIFLWSSQVGRTAPISHISLGLPNSKNSPYFTYFFRSPKQEEQPYFTYFFRAPKKEEQPLFHIFLQSSQVGKTVHISHISSGLPSRKISPQFPIFPQGSQVGRTVPISHISSWLPSTKNSPYHILLLLGHLTKCLFRFTLEGDSMKHVSILNDEYLFCNTPNYMINAYQN